jgi:hypothetical protein
MCEAEILSFDIKSSSNINVVHKNIIGWLKKISAKIEENKPDYISAFHEKLYPSFLSSIYYFHVDPSYWKKRILLNLSQQKNEININIKLISIDKKISKVNNINKWWFYWVYDLSMHLNSEIINDIPSYTIEDISKMKKEAISYSRYKILSLLVIMIIGLFFMSSSLPIFLRIIIGMSIIFSQILNIYDMLKMYNNMENHLKKLYLK